MANEAGRSNSMILLFTNLVKMLDNGLNNIFLLYLVKKCTAERAV